MLCIGWGNLLSFSVCFSLFSLASKSQVFFFFSFVIYHWCILPSIRVHRRTPPPIVRNTRNIRGSLGTASDWALHLQKEMDSSRESTQFKLSWPDGKGGGGLIVLLFLLCTYGHYWPLDHRMTLLRGSTQQQQAIREMAQQCSQGRLREERLPRRGEGGWEGRIHRAVRRAKLIRLVTSEGPSVGLWERSPSICCPSFLLGLVYIMPTHFIHVYFLLLPCLYKSIKQ